MTGPSQEPGSVQIPAAPADVPAPAPRAVVRRKITLPNAAVGRAYSAPISFGADTPAVIVTVTASGFGETGLRFDPATSTVGGSPGKAGDFPFSFQATVESEPPGSPSIVELEGVLTVNADPKTLWRDIASDPQGRFAKPDAECRALAEDGTVVVCASRRGRSHAHEGKYRDDEFGFRHAANGWWLVAVADGAGSASYSRRGSQVAVRAALDTLEDLLGADRSDALLGAVSRLAKADATARQQVSLELYNILVRAAYAGAAAIQTEAAEQKEPERSFASTLLMAMYRKVEQTHFVAAFGIGDGGIVLLRMDDDEAIPLSVADSGEYAGQTRFLTTAEFASAERAIERLHFECVDTFTALLLMTDGVTDPVLDGDERLGDISVWREVWKRDLAPAVAADGDGGSREESLLAWLDFYTPNNHDDRTLAILLPAQA